MSVDESQVIEEIVTLVSDEVFLEDNLGSNCKTYDDGTDTFLVGQCSNNYVWYSGKLWRAVLKNNETGAVKMITDNAVTAIAYNSENNTVYADSYLDQWLNQEFLPTLHDPNIFLVENSLWNVKQSTAYTSRPSGTTIQRTVGSLNTYEYYTIYGNSNGLATYQTNYLNNEVSWWTITPYSDTAIRIVLSTGSFNQVNSKTGHGVRPTVNLKSDVRIDSGTGTESDPYILKGDIQEPVNGTTLLSTRYSGDYVTFNNELYRIIGVEDGLTKITAINNSTTFSNVKFNTSTSSTSKNFATASIKTSLENYYQKLATSNINSYNMIQPNTTWYLGEVGDYTNYKASMCTTIDASKSMYECTAKASTTSSNIGLPRVGEMFTSLITRGTKIYFWTLTPNTGNFVWYIRGDGELLYYAPGSTSMGVRLSMYLKPDVVIASDNTGNGTYEKPYSIELGV